MSPTRATQKSPAAPLYPLLKLLNRQERWAAIRAAAAVPAAERSARTLIGAVAGTHAALLADLSTAVREGTPEALSLVIAPTDRQAGIMAMSSAGR